MGKHTRKMEFSKIMALIAVGMWLLVNLFGIAMIVITLDTSPLVYIIGSVDAVVAVVLSCYYGKAKLENTIKLKQVYGKDAEFVLKNGGSSDSNGWDIGDLGHGFGLDGGIYK